MKSENGAWNDHLIAALEMFSLTSNSHRYVFGDVILDRENFCVLKAGEPRDLTPRAFDVLVFLVENQGRVVEKQELFENVWKEKFVSDNALTRAIKEVRQAIGDNADAPHYIETVHKRGYRFISLVKTAEVPLSKLSAPKDMLESELTAANRTPGQPRPEIAVETGAPAFAGPLTDYPATPKGRLARTARNFWGTKLFSASLSLAILAWVALMIIKSRNQTPNVMARPAITRNAQITTWTGLDVFPTLSPDSNSVAYSSDHTGGFEIYVRQLTPGARENQLTSDGQQNLEPSWSPDGKLIAYYSRNRGGIWLVPAAGGVTTQLTDFGSRPAWSRDSTRIVFQSDGLSDISSFATAAPQSTLWVISAQGGNPVQITQPGNPMGGHGSPAWSPDGRHIAFVANNIVTAIVWTVSPAGSELQAITPEQESYFDPVYTPDGKNLLVVAGGVWRIPLSDNGAASSNPQVVANAGNAAIRNLSVSSDGKRVAYSMVRQAGNLWSVPLTRNDGGRPGIPAPFIEDTSQRKSNPLFSPDGAKVAYTVWLAGAAFSVWTVDADGKNRTQLTTEPSTIIGWLPSGDQIVTLSFPQQKVLLVSTALETSRKRLIAELAQGFQFARLSPDGKTIAFNAYRGGSVNLWVYSLADGTLKQLTFDKELLGFPAWSPDGKWIAAELKRSNDTYVALVPIDGSPPIQLHSTPGQSWTGSWSPDGDRIAFAGWRDGIWNIWCISRTTRTEQRITNHAKPNSFVRYPTWSPKGDKIVYEYAELTGNIWLAELK